MPSMLIFSIQVPFRKVTTDDYLRQMETNLLAILQDTKKLSTFKYEIPTVKVYIQIAQILKWAIARPIPPVI